MAALPTNQPGESTFPEFLAASGSSGVVPYEVDLVQRTVTYFGYNDYEYTERYPAIELP
jgi:uncharacterized protein YbcV (DUF1398 family)